METKDKVKTRMLLFGVMILLSIIITMQVLAEDQRKDQMKSSAKEWQHLSLTHTIGDTPERELRKSINKLGREGWELVSAGEHNRIRDDYQDRLLLQETALKSAESLFRHG